MATDYAVADLLAFLEFAGNKGLVNPATARPWKSSAARVLGSLDAQEQTDVRNIDVPLAIRRFGNLNPDVSPQSLRDYKGRIDRAIEIFVQYRTDPVSFKGVPQRQRRTAAIPDDAEARERPKTDTRHSSQSAAAQAMAGPQLGLSYPFPLRSGITVQISNLPRDFKLIEAERLSAFLRALTEDYKP